MEGKIGLVRSGMITPIVMDSLVLRLLAIMFGE
jgi:hypothetical protein